MSCQDFNGRKLRLRYEQTGKKWSLWLKSDWVKKWRKEQLWSEVLNSFFDRQLNPVYATILCMLTIAKTPPSYKQLLEWMWVFYGEINCRAEHPRHAKQTQGKLSEIQMVKGQVPARSSHWLDPILHTFHCLLPGEGNLAGVFWGQGFSNLLNTRTEQLCPLVRSLPSLNPKGELDTLSYIPSYTLGLLGLICLSKKMGTQRSQVRSMVQN